MSSDGDAECPICCNDLDLTDRSIQYCGCGFQPCLWCYHHILEEATKESLPARCPNCRSEYDQNKISMQHIDAEQLEEEKRKFREKDRPKGSAQRINRANLTNIRVVQPNLVYAVGLPMDICHEDVLKDVEFFGQFGKIVKVSVNRSNQYASALAKHGPTGSAYVTFKRPEDALRCIKEADGALWRGKPVKACFGTTKYCNAFLKGLPCNNPDCLYLHDLADEADCLTKEEVAAGLLPARFLAMGASNTFKPRLTINVIPNAATAAAQEAAAAAAAAGQSSAAITAAAAAAGAVSRSHAQAATSSGARVLTIPASALRANQQGASTQQQQQQQQQQHPSQQHQQQHQRGQDANGALPSSAWGTSPRQHPNALASAAAASTAHAPRGPWAAAAAAAAPPSGPASASLPQQQQQPPPPSVAQEWPTLASDSSADLGSSRPEGSSRVPPTAQGGATMAEQLARAYSTPAEPKSSRQAKKLLALSSPAKLKPLGKAVQRPTAPTDAVGSGAERKSSDGAPKANGHGASSDGGATAVGQGLSRLAVSSSGEGATSSGQVPPVGKSLVRGPPPGFGGPPGPALRPKKVTPPPGFGGASNTGGPSAPSSLDSGTQQSGDSTAAGPSASYLPFGSSSSTFDAAAAPASKPFAPASGHLDRTLVDPATAAALAAASGAGPRRHRSRFEFAQAEDEAAAAGGAGAAPPFPPRHAAVPPPLQFAPLQTAQPGLARGQAPAQPPHMPQPTSPHDASTFFKSLFPNINVNVADSAAGAPIQQHPRPPPGFGGMHTVLASPPGAPHLPSQMGPQSSALYNPLASMFPPHPSHSQDYDAHGGQPAVASSLAPGLALLRQLQGTSAGSGMPGQQPMAGGGGSYVDPAIANGRQPPAGFGAGGAAGRGTGPPPGFGMHLG